MRSTFHSRLAAAGVVALAGGAAWTALHGASAASSPPAVFAALPDAARTAVGVHLDRHDAAAHALAHQLTTKAALDVAAARIGQVQVDHATSVHVSFGDFSDDAFYTTRADGSRAYQAQGRPAFVVTYEGVSVPHRGPGTASNHELNVVVDAASGEVIEVFSFR